MAELEHEPENWKLLLRYGRLRTPYSHYTVLADGRVVAIPNEHATELGPPWLSLRSGHERARTR
jgi:hypothetical protein